MPFEFIVNADIKVIEVMKANNRIDAYNKIMEKYGDIGGLCVNAIGDYEIIGLCESCGNPIFEDEPYWHDEDGITWHKRCGDEQCNDQENT